MVGDYAYFLDYSGTKVAFAQFKDTYKQSIERIIIKELPPEDDTSSTGTTEAGPTTTTTLSKDTF